MFLDEPEWKVAIEVHSKMRRDQRRGVADFGGGQGGQAVVVAPLAYLLGTGASLVLMYTYAK